MGSPVARVGDTVDYWCILGDDFVTGTGSISEGSPTTSADGSRAVARHDDPVDCGRCGTGYIQATGTTEVDGKKIALIGNQVRLQTGQGTVSSASETLTSS